MPAETLDLNEYVPPNGGFTASQWDFGVGRAIDEYTAAVSLVLKS